VRFELDHYGRVAALVLEFDGRFEADAPPLPADLAAPSDAPATGLLGLWSGRWNGVQPHVLAVERIEGAAATVVYAWGGAPGWGIDEGGWQRQQATIEGGDLSVPLPDGGTAVYSLQSDGTLLGRLRDGGRKRQSVLRRGP
jgi:hypothetical protein